MNKKAIIVTGALSPEIGNNANLILKVADELSLKYDISLLGFGSGGQIRSYPFLPVDDKISLFKRLVASLIDHNGYSDARYAFAIYKKLKSISKNEQIDLIISTCEPYYAGISVSWIKNPNKVIYLMDPPASIIGLPTTKFRRKNLQKMLLRYNTILTTPFIQKCFSDIGFKKLLKNTETIGFPMIFNSKNNNAQYSNAKIKLLFCGSIYSDIRSPSYFLKTIQYFDKRFSITFMGKECEKINHQLKTDAEIITMPNQPYDVALKAMVEADILINIGNSVPVHFPSKLLEYISCGKPIINFYKFADCPSLYYTQRYPLSLNIYEATDDAIEIVANQIMDFCAKNRDRSVTRDYFEKEFYDCTPRYIVNKLMKRIGDRDVC